MGTRRKPLHQAAREGDVDEINRLLEVGEDVNEKDERGGTPLHWAMFKNSKRAIKLLVYMVQIHLPETDRGSRH